MGVESCCSILLLTGMHGSRGALVKLSGVLFFLLPQPLPLKTERPALIPLNSGPCSTCDGTTGCLRLCLRDIVA